MCIRDRTLTKYLADEELEKYAARYPELTIKQPPYTLIEFDDSVADDANVSNLDNKTDVYKRQAWRS